MAEGSEHEDHGPVSNPNRTTVDSADEEPAADRGRRDDDPRRERENIDYSDSDDDSDRTGKVD